MKVVLINPNNRDTGILWTTLPPLGPLYISSFLMKNGHEARFLDADIDDLKHEQIKTIIERERPDLIGITVNIIMVKAAYELAEYLKRYFDIPIAVGGPYPSAVIGKVFEECGQIDYIVYGEGEETVLELVKYLEGSCKLSDVSGLAYRFDGKICVNRPRTYIKDLDTLPFPAFELIDNISKYKGTYPIGGSPSLLVFGSRGCPFSCTFCNDSVWRSKNRKRSPENIVREIEELRSKYKIKELFFQDDTLNLDRKWFERICDLIIEKGLNKEISFKAPFRANKKMVDEALLKKAKEAGFWMLFYGVESGDPRTLAVISKDIGLDEIERAFTLTEKAGIRTLASFMIGNLGEDRESIMRSMEFFKKIDPDYGGFSIATPFPGTVFYIDGLKKGLLHEYDFKTFQFGKAVANTGFLKPEEVEELHKNVYEEIRMYKKSLVRKTRKFLSSVAVEGIRKALWLSLNGEKMFFEGIRYPRDMKGKTMTDLRKDFEYINQNWDYGIQSKSWIKRLSGYLYRIIFRRQVELNASFVRILNEFGAVRNELEALKNILRPKVYVDEGAQIKAGGEGFDYYGFEKVFRPEGVVKERQVRYLEFFRGKNSVLDVGCGRGEFLQLLKENGIGATGVDNNADMVARCREKGFNAVHADFKDYLDSLADNSIDGVFSTQFIEHIPFELLDAFFKLAYRKLKPGGVIVSETVNPYHLAAFRFFYVDPTHVKPLYPEVLEFLSRSAGFQKIRVKYFSDSPSAEKLEEPWDFPEYAIVAEKLS